jgi:hypothetical protein
VPELMGFCGRAPLMYGNIFSMSPSLVCHCMSELENIIFFLKQIIHIFSIILHLYIKFQVQIHSY